MKDTIIDLLEYEDDNLWSNTWTDGKYIFISITSFLSISIPVSSFLAWVEFLRRSFNLYIEQIDTKDKEKKGG